MSAAQVWLRELTAADLRQGEHLTVQALVSAEEAAALGGMPADARPFADPVHWAAFIVVGGQRSS